MHDALGLAGGSRSVEHKQRMLRIERLGGTHFTRTRDQIVPPVIAALLHVNMAAGALVYDYLADTGAFRQSFLDSGFQLDFLAAPPAAIGGDDNTCSQILDSDLERLRREPPNTTEWMMPSRAQASRAIGNSGTIGM